MPTPEMWTEERGGGFGLTDDQHFAEEERFMDRYDYPERGTYVQPIRPLINQEDLYLSAKGTLCQGSFDRQ